MRHRNDGKRFASRACTHQAPTTSRFHATDAACVAGWTSPTQDATMHSPNPGQDPSQPPDEIPGQIPHPARDPVPDQPVDPIPDRPTDPTIPPMRDPGTAPRAPDAA
jgi:hypothetical protein